MKKNLNKTGFCQGATTEKDGNVGGRKKKYGERGDGRWKPLITRSTRDKSREREKGEEGGRRVSKYETDFQSIK